MLEDELNGAEEGNFRLVLLLGEAGVGKTRLGRELLARHPEATGLVAQAYPLAASAAFGLWTEALDPFLQPLPDDEVVDLCGGLLDDLASLFHRVALVRGSVPDRDPPLPRVLQGLAGLLGKVLRRTPLVVLLDDVHLADASSWEAVRYFARHLDDAPLLVVATARPADLARHEVAAPVLFELEQDALLTRLEVGALAHRPLRELTEVVIERPAPRVLVDWVCERSQGNPLFAIGLLRALIDEGGDLSAPNLRRLPEGLTERARRALASWGANPRIEILGSTELERLATVSFGVRHRGRLLHANFVAALLNDLFGIQARSGCFCAGPYIHRLYGIDDRWSDRMSAQAVKGQMGALLSFTRVGFNLLHQRAGLRLHPRRDSPHRRSTRNPGIRADSLVPAARRGAEAVACERTRTRRHETMTVSTVTGVVNESEARAAAGLTMVTGAVAFSYAYFDKQYVPL